MASVGKKGGGTKTKGLAAAAGRTASRVVAAARGVGTRFMAGFRGR